MKSILVHLENKEYEKLAKTKGNKSWKDFLISLGRLNDRKTTSRKVSQ